MKRIVLLLTFLMTIYLPLVMGQGQPAAPVPVCQQLFDLTNAERVKAGLAPLTANPNLAAAAQWMAQDMANKNYFSHTDSLGRDPFQRMHAYGYNYRAAAENIAAGTSSPSQTVQMWLESSGHRANMLNSLYTELGVGCAANPASQYNYYWMQDFGAR